jgi:hypothetical protein
MKKNLFIPLAAFLLPLVSSAAFGGIQNFITDIGTMVRSLTVLMAGIALLVFFWGLVKFIMKAGDEAALEEGRRLMMWGIIALFVMVSVWGIILFIQTNLNIFGGGTPPIPQFPTP